MIAVVNVMVKRRDRRSRHVWMRETSANEPPMTHRKHLDGIELRGAPLPWEEHSGYLLTGYAVSGGEGGVTLMRALVRNLRTWLVMLREKAQVAEPWRPKVPMR